MPFRVGDRVKEYTVSTGTGGVSLIGAYSGFQKFDDVLTIGDTTYYVIEENDKWEVGIGTYGSNNLERTTVLDSSSGGSKISLGGSGTVSITYPASGAVFTDDLSSVSGWAATYSDAGDASVSGWAAATFITSDDDSYVSGVAAYASGQSVSNQSEIASVSGWAESYIDSQDHSAASVSGWAEDTFSSSTELSYVSGIAVYASGNSGGGVGDVTTEQLNYVSGISVYGSGQAVENESQISSVSGWANATFITSDDDSYVSGVAVYASGHNLQSITDNGATTNNAVTINNNLTAENLYGDLYGPIVFECKNSTGSQIDGGTPVYVSGYYSNNGKPLISPAVGNDVSKMPAVGIVASDLADGSEGHVHVFGEATRLDTSSFDVGDTVYVASSGGFTNVRPTGVDELVQNMGRVLRSDNNQGRILLLGPGRTNDVPNSGTFADLTVNGQNILDISNYASGQAVTNESEIASVSGWAESYIDSQDHSAASVSGWAGVYADAGDVAVSGWALSYIDSQDHSAASVSGWAEATFLTADDDTYVSGIAAYASGQAVENEADIAYVSGIAAGGITEIPLSGLQFIKSGSNDEYRIGTTFVDPDGTEQVVRASDFNGGYLRLEVARFSPSVSANGQSRYWDQPVSQWTVTVDNPTDFTTNYVSGVKSPLTSVANGVVTTDVTLYSTSGPSVTPDGGVDWTQTFSTDVDSPIYSSGTGLTGGSASATVSFLDKNQDTISETATISFSWLNASSSISFNNLSGNNFLQLYSSVGYNLTISNLSNSSNASTTITTGQGTLSNSSDDGTMTFTTPIHKNNNSGRTITATTDFTRPATVTGTEYTTQRVVSDSSISASFTYPSFRIFTSSTSNPPSRADIVDTNDFDSSVVTELGNQVKTLSQTINNPESLAQCMWFAVRSSASQPTSFQTGSSSSLLSDVTPTETTVSLEPDSPAAGYVAEGYNLYGITLQPGNTYVSIS